MFIWYLKRHTWSPKGVLKLSLTLTCIWHINAISYWIKQYHTIPFCCQCHHDFIFLKYEIISRLGARQNLNMYEYIFSLVSQTSLLQAPLGFSVAIATDFGKFGSCHCNHMTLYVISLKKDWVAPCEHRLRASWLKMFRSKLSILRRSWSI